MRARALLTAIALIFSPSSAFSAPSPKAGAACSKVGVVKDYKGKKFVCTKSGGKLIWSKGATSKPKPGTLSPIPSPSPTPSGVKAAMENFYLYPKSQSAPQEVNFHFGPNADKEHSELIVSISNETMKFMADHFPDSRPYPFFYGSLEDTDWIIAEWAKYGYRDQWEIDDAKRRGPNGLVVTYWNSPQAATTMIYSQEQLKNQKNISIYNYAESDRVQTQQIAHHVIHGIQQRAAGDGRYGFLHCWAREGGAEFYGAMIVHRAKKGEYLAWRNNHLGNWFGSPSKIDPRKLADAEWLDLLNSLDCHSGENLPYIYGALLTERLVGEYGHQKVMDWWHGMRLTKDWKEAFQSAFGIEVQAWYKTSGIPYLVTAYKEWIPDKNWAGYFNK